MAVNCHILFSNTRYLQLEGFQDIQSVTLEVVEVSIFHFLNCKRYFFGIDNMCTSSKFKSTERYIENKSQPFLWALPTPLPSLGATTVISFLRTFPEIACLSICLSASLLFFFFNTDVNTPHRLFLVLYLVFHPLETFSGKSHHIRTCSVGSSFERLNFPL